MYNADSPFSSPVRSLIIVFALVGIVWMLIRAFQPSELRPSMWQGQGLFGKPAVVAPAAPAGGLTGVMTQQTGRGPSLNPEMPQGDPLESANAVMTQGYGVGSHAPAAVWGAIDLALDGNGDGQADPQGTLGKPVYATQSGVIKLAANTWPAGNHIWVENEKYRTGYSHLLDFAVTDGQTVQPGTLIGHIGATGEANGPHLDYQLWEMANGAWVNRNPLDYGGADK